MSIILKLTMVRKNIHCDSDADVHTWQEPSIEGQV
nr:MAG TPA: hypothetical protein [Caudoviricetes sp.]